MLGELTGLCSQLIRGRWPSRRALAAWVKLHGKTLHKRWPFVRPAGGISLNLGYQDVLALQWAIKGRPMVVVVGAFDGVSNDPLLALLSKNQCKGLLVEPQPGAFARLRKNLGHYPALKLVNAAIDRESGMRNLYFVEPAAGLPAWTEQLASFNRDHIVKHEGSAPGLTAQIRCKGVKTFSFADLLSQEDIRAIDVLQIDAEGFDAQILEWFPFERLKPTVMHYEIAHMTPNDLEITRHRLVALGYKIHATESPRDEMAVLA